MRLKRGKMRMARPMLQRSVKTSDAVCHSCDAKELVSSAHKLGRQGKSGPTSETRARCGFYACCCVRPLAIMSSLLLPAAPPSGNWGAPLIALPRMLARIARSPAAQSTGAFRLQPAQTAETSTGAPGPILDVLLDLLLVKHQVASLQRNSRGCEHGGSMPLNSRLFLKPTPTLIAAACARMQLSSGTWSIKQS